MTTERLTADGLLPCPFCGSEAEKILIGNDYTKTRKVVIKCSNHLCRTEQITGAIRNSHQWCEEVAIKKWNARQEVAAIEMPKPRETPVAYEWHNNETGHCYVDYIPHVGQDEDDGYVKIPLYDAIEMPTDEEAEEQAQSLYKAGMDLADESPISYTHKQLCLHEAQGHRAGAGWFRSRMEGEGK